MDMTDVEKEIRAMFGPALEENVNRWASKDKGSNTSKKDKAYAKKQSDSDLPADLFGMAMAGLW